MVVSNTFSDFNMQLKMDNTVLKIVETHKHLGVILSSNNKWHKHIETLIESASNQISYLRKVKYRFSKDILSKLYCCYIRPLLEYASEVWDGCTQTDANRLEQVQLNAVRIVTGLPVFASLNSLYSETGWESLADRRKNKKLSLMFKIINNEAPSYLTDLLPEQVSALSSYNLRNSQNFEVPFTRLCSYETSFIPSTLKLWNNLDIVTRSASSISQFKKCLKRTPKKTSEFLSNVDRALDIILVRIRHKCSSLNGDLFRVNIIPYSKCDCGSDVESAEHYFFECSFYTEQRNRLLERLNFIPFINLELLTKGSSQYDVETNKCIYLAVTKYIKETQRFL